MRERVLTNGAGLAGFVEPGESVEDAVRREVQEEAGVRVGDVYYHSSQPWPFPANLMLGAFAQVLPGQEIRLDLDNELEDARFVPRHEVLAVLAQQDEKGALFSQKELQQMDKEDGPGGGRLPRDVTVRFPGPTAIAHTLIAAWAHKEAVIPPVASKLKM